MIITRTPLRVSLVGGGSDVPSFCMEHPGATVTVAIDQYVYTTVSPAFSGGVRAAYRQIEDVACAADVQHELIRECLKMHRIARGVEVHSIADVPGGTGLGSSSAFTVGLLAALAVSQDRSVDPLALARAACTIEIERCGKAIGQQDQYAAALGGVYLLRFHETIVDIAPVVCDAGALGQYLLLLYTGRERLGDAGEHLARARQDHGQLRELAAMAPEVASALRFGLWREVGEIMHRAWQIKRTFVSNAAIDITYALARQAGAWGGKLCGAGGGGFMLFLAPPDAHQAIVAATGLRAVDVRAGVGGCEVVHEDHDAR